MKIEVLGTGCAKCDTAEKIVKAAVAKCGVDVRVVKVSDRMEIAESGVPMTPAVIMNGQVKVVGKIPDIDDVIIWINEMKKRD